MLKIVAMDVTDAESVKNAAVQLKDAEVAEIEKQGTPLEYEIHVKPGIVEGIVDQHRVEVTRA